MQLMPLSYVPNHSQDHADSECVSYVGTDRISEPSLSVTDTQTLEFIFQKST